MSGPLTHAAAHSIVHCFGIKRVRDRSSPLSEYKGFAGKRTQLQVGGLQDLFQSLSEELPEGGVSWKVHIRHSEHTCPGQRLLQHQAGRDRAAAAQLHLAGESRTHFNAGEHNSKT
ncbi:hypothetical protein XENOCAPTIV_012971 [Xenoophorus captivus]|uniref:Uncharacterized protein n=1 Tax=Xenoophorus captivus TaxID=1517983 RepID=A0ABV0QIR5_9TELE